MRRAQQEVTETELAILQVLWDRGEANRRQVTDVLERDRRRVVHHDVDAAELLDRLRHGARDRVLVPHIADDRQGMAAGP